MQITNLRAYLIQVGMNMKQFAEKIGCNRCYLATLLSGKAYASARLSKDIFEATGGVIRMPTRKDAKKKIKEETQNQRVAKAAQMASTMMTHYDAFDENKQD